MECNPFGVKTAGRPHAEVRGVVRKQVLGLIGGIGSGKSRVAAEFEKATTNLPLQQQQSMGHEMPGGVKPDKPQMVPGYPQDMFVMMDDEVTKPETYGLRRTWSGGMMGMMTLVRVLEPNLYDKIRSLQARAAQEKPTR